MVFRAGFCSPVTLEGQKLSHSIIALWERLGVWVLCGAASPFPVLRSSFNSPSLPC